MTSEWTKDLIGLLSKIAGIASAGWVKEASPRRLLGNAMLDPFEAALTPFLSEGLKPGETATLTMSPRVLARCKRDQVSRITAARHFAGVVDLVPSRNLAIVCEPPGDHMSVVAHAVVVTLRVVMRMASGSAIGPAVVRFGNAHSPPEPFISDGRYIGW